LWPHLDGIGVELGQEGRVDDDVKWLVDAAEDVDVRHGLETMLLMSISNKKFRTNFYNTIDNFITIIYNHSTSLSYWFRNFGHTKSSKTKLQYK
jgi:hypothetical protein